VIIYLVTLRRRAPSYWCVREGDEVEALRKEGRDGELATRLELTRSRYSGLTQVIARVCSQLAHSSKEWT
jgi:hypothetical protein